MWSPPKRGTSVSGEALTRDHVHYQLGSFEYPERMPCAQANARSCTGSIIRMLPALVSEPRIRASQSSSVLISGAQGLMKQYVLLMRPRATAARACSPKCKPFKAASNRHRRYGVFMVDSSACPYMEAFWTRRISFVLAIEVPWPMYARTCAGVHPYGLSPLSSPPPLHTTIARRAAL